MAKAKRKSKSKSKRRGTGNVITTRRARTSGLGSLGGLNKPGTFAGAFIPPLIGGGLTALTTLAVSKMAADKQKQQAEAQQQAQAAAMQQTAAAMQQQGQDSVQGLGYTRSHWHQFGLGAAQNPQQQQSTAAALRTWAPAIGVAVGGISSFALYSLGGKHAGLGAAAGALGVGGALLVYAVMYQQQQPQGQNPVGAIVPEYGTSGLGAIVMEPEAAQGYNAYSGGQDVGVRGLGSGLAGGLGAQMDVSAFGPASF